jgi:hypothetical protein
MLLSQHDVHSANPTAKKHLKTQTTPPLQDKNSIMNPRLIEHDQHHFEHLDKIPLRLANASAICSIIKPLVPPLKSIVDVGCGYGFS